MTAVIVLGILIVAVIIPTVIAVARDARGPVAFDSTYDSRRPGL
jgi:hypothetical protein